MFGWICTEVPVLFIQYIILLHVQQRPAFILELGLRWFISQQKCPFFDTGFESLQWCLSFLLSSWVRFLSHRLATIHFCQRLPHHKHITHHTAGPSLLQNQRCHLSRPCMKWEHSRLKFWGCTIPTYASIVGDIPNQACLHMDPQATGTFKWQLGYQWDLDLPCFKPWLQAWTSKQHQCLKGLVLGPPAPRCNVPFY